MVFQNHQWRVTERGLTAVLPGTSPPYHIETERLLLRREGGLYLWPMQVAAKSWVDLDAFEEAFRHAVQLVPASNLQKLDPDLLERSIGASRALVRKHP
ncbi:MAG: hypothetical protein JWM36_1190 [Hyphomicrobiales bacterium]|nr:hypothetical protein [Hyphomicrobiales bacterium]